jgi:hypothetical protein
MLTRWKASIRSHLGSSDKPNGHNKENLKRLLGDDASADEPGLPEKRIHLPSQFNHQSPLAPELLEWIRDTSAKDKPIIRERKQSKELPSESMATKDELALTLRRRNSNSRSRRPRR